MLRFPIFIILAALLTISVAFTGHGDTALGLITATPVVLFVSFLFFLRLIGN